MSDELNKGYGSFYSNRDPAYVYPVEFVVRALLGTYPRHQSAPATYRGQRVLDLGFGDGRNMPLLHNLGMQVFGLEISQEICDLTKARMNRLGVDAMLDIGRNCKMPYGDAFFDRILACHSCYYVDEGTRFDDNIKEMARVLKPGGICIFSAPKSTSYIMRGAIDLGDGHMQIANDPYGVRNGYILKKFDDERDIAKSLSSAFTDFEFGSCENDFWGVEEHVWIVVCRRATRETKQ